MAGLRDVLSEFLCAYGNLPSARKISYRVNCWCRHASALLPITKESVAQFQASAQAASLSPVTINDTVADVLFLCRVTGHAINFEVKRLDEPAPNPQPPAVRDVGKLYSVCDQALWPTKWSQQDRAAWWRGFIVCAFHWPLRNGDLFRLTTANIFDAVGEQFPRVECKRGLKTGALYSYPITNTVRRHLSDLLRITHDPSGHTRSDSLLMVKPGSVRFVRRELKRLCGLAGIPEQTIKRLRSASLTAYECLDGDMGRLAHHGLSLDVRAHYVPQSVTMARKLWRHITELDVPEEMLDPHERRRNRESLAQLLRIAKRMPADEVRKLARIAGAM